MQKFYSPSGKCEKITFGIITATIGISLVVLPWLKTFCFFSQGETGECTLNSMDRTNVTFVSI